MTNRETEAGRLAPLFGVVTAVLSLIGLLALGSNTPDTSDGGAKVVSFYTANSSQQEVAAYLVALAGVALLVFGASLRSRLTAEASPWASVVTTPVAVIAADS